MYSPSHCQASVPVINNHPTLYTAPNYVKMLNMQYCLVAAVIHIQFLHSQICIYMYIYRVSQEEWTKLRESVPYVKLNRYNPKHLYPKLNSYGDNGHRKCGLLGCPHTVSRP